MELRVIYPPYANLSPSPTRRLQHRIITPPCLPPFHLPHWVCHPPSTCPPVSWSISLRLFVGEKRPPPVVPLECWVGEKYRLQPNLFPLSLQSLPCAYHFQLQHQTLEGWQSAWGKTISAGLEVYLKMHFSSLVTSQPVSTLWYKRPEYIQIHTMSHEDSITVIRYWTDNFNISYWPWQ